jgi:AraC-like DNA-binding protein
MRHATSAAPLRQLAACSTWTQRVGAFTALPTLVAELGASADATLGAAGLATRDISHPDQVIPYTSLARVLHEAARRARCPHFGLLAGRLWHLHDLGVVGTLMRHAPTVRDALHALTVHQHLNTGGGLAYLIERGDAVDFGYAIYHPEIEDSTQLNDSVMVTAFNAMRELCGPRWLPVEVLLPHARPDDVAPFKQTFKAPVRFDAELCAIRFSRHWMDQRVDGADATIRERAQAQVNDMGGELLLAQVFRALRTLLLYGRDSGDEVAQMLSMHRRTLNRRLKAEGTTFRDVLDQVRFDVARHLLAETTVSLDDVAATLGYAGVSPFMRTFRRWAGTTPARWRRDAIERDVALVMAPPRAAHREASYVAR